MAKIQEISFNDEFVIFTDDKNVSEKIALETPDRPADAVRVMKKEVGMRANASRAAVSVLIQILQSARMETYRGKSPMGQRIDPVVMSAVRELEEQYLKPIYFDTLPKNLKETEKLVEWDGFITQLRQPGSYAQTKAVVMKYFAHLGKLPCLYHEETAVPEKLLTVSAMNKILQASKEKAPKQTTDHSIGASLEAISGFLDKNETTLSIDMVERALRATAAITTKLNALRAELNQQATEHAQVLVNQSTARAQDKAKAQDKEPAHA